MGSKIRSTGIVFYSLLSLNSGRGLNGLNYVYSLISVIVDSLPGNTKNRESTRSWTARVGGMHTRYKYKCMYTCTIRINV